MHVESMLTCMFSIILHFSAFCYNYAYQTCYLLYDVYHALLLQPSAFLCIHYTQLQSTDHPRVDLLYQSVALYVLLLHNDLLQCTVTEVLRLVTCISLVLTYCTCKLNISQSKVSK